MHPTTLNLTLALSGATLLGALLGPQAVHAGGIDLYEIATPDVGLASAGYAARAQDASTVFSNPAGMSLLEGFQFQAGGQLTYGSVAFSHDASTSGFLGTGNGGNAIGALPAASLFCSLQLSDRLAVGLGTFSYFGLAEQFENNWVGRYYAQKNTLFGVSLMPAASLRLTDWLSVGAGLNAMYGYLDTQVAVRTGASSDGQLQAKDETWGFGANVGLLLELYEGTRFGLTYLSPVNLDFKARPSFSNLGPLGGGLFASPPQLDLGLTVPQAVMFSVYHELTPDWALLANAGWQNWHQFGKVDVGVDSPDPQSLTTKLNFQDTWHGAVGAQYHLTGDWLLSAGFAYDSSAVSDANRTLSLPMGQAYRLGLGAQWNLTESFTLGAAYEFLWTGDLPVTQESAYRGRVSGSFENTWFSFFSLNLMWVF